MWNSASASSPPIDLVGRLELCSGRELDRYLAIGTQILSGRVRTESFPNTHFLCAGSRAQHYYWVKFLVFNSSSDLPDKGMHKIDLKKNGF